MESALNATFEVLSFGVRVCSTVKVSDDMQPASPSVEGVGTPGHHVTNDVHTAQPRFDCHRVVLQVFSLETLLRHPKRLGANCCQIGSDILKEERWPDQLRRLAVAPTDFFNYSLNRLNSLIL